MVFTLQTLYRSQLKDFICIYLIWWYFLSEDPSKNTNGKCSHGGPLDNTTTTVAAIGGINKDSKVFTNSPHYYSHSKAAEAAVGHTLYFFNDNSMLLYYKAKVWNLLYP